MAGLSVLMDRTGCSCEPKWDLRIGSNVFAQLERTLPLTGCLFYFPVSLLEPVRDFFLMCLRNARNRTFATCI